MTYSKEYLDNLIFNSSAHHDVIHDLLSKAEKKEKLTFYESDFVFNLTRLLNAKNHNERLDHRSFDCCRNPYFKYIYLIYAGNLNGGKPAFDYDGQIPIDRKIQELKELELEHQNWLTNLSKFNHKDRLMNLISSEANIEIKEITKLAKKECWGANLLDSKIKGVSLHSKYIYISVSSMFEETQSDTVRVDCGGKEVVIDINSIVHIFWRHYAGIAKQYDTKKSFHLDAKIKHFDLPSELARLLAKIGNLITIGAEVNFFIPVKIRGIVYSIWTKRAKESIKEKGLIEVIRLQTFYPTESKDELQRINVDYNEIVIDSEFSVYKEKNAL